MSDDDVSVNDLLMPLEDTNEFGDLKHMVEKTPQAMRETSQLAQDRANLSAAYDLAKENVTEWAPVVKEMQKQRTITFEDTASEMTFDHFEPQKTKLGNEIDEILKAEKLTRDAQLTLEDDALNHLSEEQIRERVEQLSRLRNLQFYNEQKARRWKKIKSKAFRRLHKKDMQELSLEELAEVDPEAFQARLHKLEVERAKERVTQRHKNTSFWVRRVLARGLKAASDEVKASYEDQVRRGEELSRKIQEYNMQGDDDDDEEVPLVNPIKQDRELANLFDMKFMKDAEEMKEQKREELRKAFAQDTEPTEATSGIVTIRSDRGDFQKKPTPAPEMPATEEKPVPPAQPVAVAAPLKEEEPAKEETPAEEPKSENPWLSKRKRGKRFVSAASSIQITSEDLQKAAEKINFSKSEEQREILEEAFGLADEFKREKEAAALKEAEEGMTPMSDLHKAGWGSWTGAGAKESEGSKKRREAIERRRDEIVKAALKERKDAKMPHVMLHDGVDPAVDKYAMDLPKMYTNPKQLKAQLAYPLMPEVNSSSGFNRLIAQDMIAEAGKIINPIRFTKMMKLKERIQKRNQQRKPLEQGGLQ